jgi:hypothetical protein
MNALVTVAERCLPVAFEAELELASDFAKASLRPHWRLTAAISASSSAD